MCCTYLSVLVLHCLSSFLKDGLQLLTEPTPISIEVEQHDIIVSCRERKERRGRRGGREREEGREGGRSERGDRREREGEREGERDGVRKEREVWSGYILLHYRSGARIRL